MTGNRTTRRDAASAVTFEDAAGDGAARPLPDVEEFVEAIVALLERSGAGRWRVVDLNLDDLAASPAGIVPIEVREGAVACVLQADPDDVGPDGPSEEALVQARLAGRLLATRLDLGERRQQLVRRAERAERLALADALTDLPNRRGWWDAVRRESARCKREGRSALVAVVDLDDLKVVNDSQGHLAGDLLLVQAARALRSALRAGDLVGRVGGDEFAVFAVSGEDRTSDAAVDRMRNSLESAGIRASIGRATLEPGDDPTDLYREADQAMYDEKAHRKGGRQ